MRVVVISIVGGVGAENAEVLLRHQGDLVLVQVHLDPVLRDAVDGDVEEHTRVLRRRRRRHLERSKTRVLEQYFPSSSMVFNLGSQTPVLLFCKETKGMW